MKNVMVVVLLLCVVVLAVSGTLVWSKNHQVVQRCAQAKFTVTVGGVDHCIDKYVISENGQVIVFKDIDGYRRAANQYEVKINKLD